MNTSVYQGSVVGSTTNRSRFGASARRKFMHNAVVPTPRDLKEQSKGMQPILHVGQVLQDKIEVSFDYSRYAGAVVINWSNNFVFISKG